MKIILNDDVYNLGEEGDVCTVADGYARNYLIPKHLAVPFNRSNEALFTSRAASIAKKKEQKRKKALSLKETIEELSLEIRVSAGDSGKLFGAVTSATIAEALAKAGLEIEKKKIDVPSHTIKMVGPYTVKVRLYESETADLKVSVVNERIAEKEEKEAAAAARKAASAASAAAAAKAAEAVVEESAAEESEKEE